MLVASVIHDESVGSYVKLMRLNMTHAGCIHCIHYINMDMYLTYINSVRESSRMIVDPDDLYVFRQ